MQYADAKFERRDPFPHVPFEADDDAEDFPSVSEVVGWELLAVAFGTLCCGFLSL